MNNIGIATSMYNGYDKYLIRWIKSICNSIIRPDKIIICQAGIKYNRKNVIKALTILKQNNIKYKFIKIDFKDMGTARNAAINELNTKWVMYLDVDDELLRNGLKYVLRHINKKCDVIVGGMLIKENKKKLRKYFSENLYSKEELKKGKWLNSHSLFKKELFKKVQYPKTEYCNNFFWAAIATTNARFIYINNLITIYNKHNTSHSNIVTKADLNKWELELKEFLKGIKNNEKRMQK